MNQAAKRRIIYRETDPLFGRVNCLIGFGGNDGQNIARDMSRLSQVVTFAGNAQVSSAQSRFGGSSLLCDGTGDYVSVPSVSLPGDFTAECFVRWVSRKAFGAIWLGGGTTTQVFVTLKADGTGLRAGRTGIAEYVNGNFTWSNGIWYHVACVRINSDWRLYVDGADITAGQTPNSFAASGELRFCGDGGTTFDSNAYIDEMRITAAARYFGSFSPPQRPFPRGQ